MRQVAEIRVGLLWRGNPNHVEPPNPRNNRLYPLFKAFSDLKAVPEPVVFSDDIAPGVRAHLLELDGVLVWVDPITDDQDRSKLDSVLRDVSSRGVWVSAHPDIILKIGTKEVLFRTKQLGWGTDTHLYATVQEFMGQFQTRLKSDGVRVLKQTRGNGGIGTWKVRLIGTEPDPTVCLQEARRDSSEECLPLSGFMARCGRFFSGSSSGLIDQAFQARAGEGMIRCYLVHNQVVGFSTQMPSAPGNFAMAREKTMHDYSEPRFAGLKTKMESEWVPALQRLFTIDASSLPVVWDADFFHGPKADRGEDTYVLGEINVSAVLPFPESAVARVAQAALTQISAAKSSRDAKATGRHR